MFKKLLVLPILLFSLSILYAQQLPLDISNENTKNKNPNLTFKQVSENYEDYFATKDIDKKGSGYKPFKRWEYRWSQYLQEDGAIAPAEHLWQVWEQKKKMSKSAKIVSNWTDNGPFSQSSNSGQGRVNTVGKPSGNL
ncbi:MAG: hypothetical protein L3J20_03335 [Flavobacteriaceae bacterium]|nr:hypothetical protein [Flavobacteriaceae bacterium]